MYLVIISLKNSTSCSIDHKVSSPKFKQMRLDTCYWKGNPKPIECFLLHRVTLC
jgi:hypothetical protein